MRLEKSFTGKCWNCEEIKELTWEDNYYGNGGKSCEECHSRLMQDLEEALF